MGRVARADPTTAVTAQPLHESPHCVRELLGSGARRHPYAPFVIAGGRDCGRAFNWTRSAFRASMLASTSWVIAASIAARTACAVRSKNGFSSSSRSGQVVLAISIARAANSVVSSLNGFAVVGLSRMGRRSYVTLLYAPGGGPLDDCRKLPYRWC